jgi:hypothetical protein
MNFNKRLFFPLCAFLISFFIVFYRSTIYKTITKNTQSIIFYWKKRFHTTLATFEGGKEDNVLAQEDLEHLKTSSLDFELSFFLGDIDLLTRATVSTRSILNTQEGKTLNTEHYYELMKTNPPTHYKPWYLIIKFSDKNKQEIDPYNSISGFFSNLHKVNRPYFPHITIATVKKITDPQRFLKIVLDANSKFIAYLKKRKKPAKIKFNKETLYISKPLGSNPRFILANTIKRSSKAFRAIQKAINFIKDTE